MTYVLQLKQETPKPTRFTISEDQKKQVNNLLQSMFEQRRASPADQATVPAMPAGRPQTAMPTGRPQPAMPGLRDPAPRQAKKSTLNVQSQNDPKQQKLLSFGFQKSQPDRSPLERS